MNIFPESKLAHKWLDGLSGLEVGPSTHNPFGLKTRNVGLKDHIYYEEQMTLVGQAASLDILAEAEAIPILSESEDFVLSSHVIEHCPNFLKTLWEWYRITKPGGFLYLIAPHPDAAPGDRGRPLTEWAHVVEDYVFNTTGEAEPEAGRFLHCHYHVFSLDTMKEFFSRFFGRRLLLVDSQKKDDKIGNGFTLVYQKPDSLLQGYPWTLGYQGKEVSVSKPADFYLLKESVCCSPLTQSTLRKAAVASDPVSPTQSSNILENKVLSPKISVIVAAYNAEKFMRGALVDLEEQTIADEIEIIIVETASQTEEYKIITEFQSQFPNIIYVRTSTRENPAAACNRGIQMARGQYITLAPTDDRRRADALEILAGELDAHPEIALVYGDVLVTNFENQQFAVHIRCGYHIRPEFSPDIMLSGCHMGPQAMWRKSIHKEVGYFNETLPSATDYEFWCRIAERFTMKHIPAFLGLYYENPQGVINSNPERAHKETQEIQNAFRNKFPAPKGNYLNNFQYFGPVQLGKFVNIGMVTFNRLEFTKASIASIFQFTCFPHVLTVVDNGSTDGTVEYLQAIKKEGIITNLILLKKNVGVAKASNLAWSQEPEAEYYLKLDNDIVIQKPHWLVAMVDVLDSIQNLGMVAYNFEPWSYSLQTMNGRQVRPKEGSLGGACVLIPKRTKDKFGYWCEDYGLYGEEDADYGGRIMIAGLKNAYMEDESIGVHLPAGRAANIDSQTFVAQDGAEEFQDADYRLFKDDSRRSNQQGPFKKNLEFYQTGEKDLYCRSQFVEIFRSGMSEVVLPTISKGELERPVQSVAFPESSTPSRRRVSVVPNDKFCGTLRLYYPLQSFMKSNQLQGNLILEADIYTGKVEFPVGAEESVVIQRIPTLIEPKLKAAKSQGTRIVHDLDDLLWKVPGDNHNSKVITPPMLDCLFRAVEQADCVTVSTLPLQQALDLRGISSLILPNCLLKEQWEGSRPRRRTGLRPRVGWVGQLGVHQADVAILSPVMEMLGLEVEWVFLGEVPDVRPGFRFEAETHAMVPLQDFPAKLASLNLDLALAPLAMNEFNEAKSDLRILQYGILGYPVIATDIFPYQAAPVSRVPNDPTAWVQAIRDHVHNPDSSEAQGETLRQWVLANRMFDQWASHYQSAWLGESVVEKMKPESVHAPHVSYSVAPSRVDSSKISYDCSIIIPLFNRADLTKQCLEHLSEATKDITYEVILVDNHSSDGTAELFSALSGDIQFIRNQENLGFAKACNQGAAEAKGRYLIFLNNDTIPQEGWLLALVNEVEQYPDVAVVGSKLLFPDNTIQHAGVVFSKNCLVPYHIFRGESSQLAAVNKRREFQAVTAACFLVRREDWDSVGGFDEEFRNGFEDVDFCLKIRERGRKIIYQPKSVLYHLEHQSPGRKDKAAENHNGRLLMDRWASKIIPDEDIYFVSEGYADKLYIKDGMIRQKLFPFTNDQERQQWQRLAQIQTLLIQLRENGISFSKTLCPPELKQLLSEYSAWPEDLECLRWGAELCRTWKVPESEFGFWQRVLQIEEDPNAREFFAKQAMRENNLRLASQHIMALIGSPPHEATGYGLQGILLMQSKEYSAAADSFSQALSKGFDSRKAGLGLGLAHMGMENPEMAWKVFEKVSGEFPDEDEALQGLIQAGTALQCWSKLSGHLHRYLLRNPADCAMRFALAGVEFRAGHPDKAKEQLTWLRLVQPDFEGLEDLDRVLANPQDQGRLVSVR
ncbi:MAG: glycosyltransferase [Nitrospirota bacterium]|nr:glycosyltransferase [Nitrospirota bacterium]MDH5585754.1 glycosyltransferase [Nitrospirota bacterium]MDH5773685.1 glycosyltransferase [Nitrospirota bacterium]